MEHKSSRYHREGLEEINLLKTQFEGTAAKTTAKTLNVQLEVAEALLTQPAIKYCTVQGVDVPREPS